MQRRTFLTRSAAALIGAGVDPRVSGQAAAADWRSLRLVAGAKASLVERTALEDAAGLFSRAVGTTVPVVVESTRWGRSDVLVGCANTTRALPVALVPPDGRPGQYAARSGAAVAGGPRLAIGGVDPEGARNGVYAWMERLGFGFFRDGDVVPALTGSMPADAGVAFGATPAFRWRGDMIWDNYLGPRRHCAAVWGEDEWERALLFMARRGLNLLEFYPPLEHVLARAFPKAAGLSEGAVWMASVKHAMTARVLARGRALGIRFMYVLNYGFFPEAVRALYPTLEWANGHLCAHQPELAAMAARTWRTLVAEFGTDHLYAIRHRGEEGQSYSDPCRSVTKAEGYRQAIDALHAVDPQATVTVWTWGETPDLFTSLPSGVRAAHIRHGMGGVFGDRGQGREQADGRPALAADRRWLSGQFTVFGGNEVSMQTPWSDAVELARDARASAADPSCEGYFQWPEWSDASPWISHVITRLAWAPDGFGTLESESRAYARARHGSRADAFLAGMLPILRAGHARFTSTPRKRFVVPYWLSADSLAHIVAVRAGARTMAAALGSGEPSTLFDRDVTDVCEWLGIRLAHIFEADAYRRHRTGDDVGALGALDAADATWDALGGLLATIPERSILDAAARAVEMGEPSSRFVESFWVNACDFYGGYPLIMSPEAIELVYRPQLARWRQLMAQAGERRQPMTLDPPGWFWHDFPHPAWADAARKLPSEDAALFEQTMRARLLRLVQGAVRRTPAAAGPRPSSPSRVNRAVVLAFLARTTSVPLPAPLDVDGLQAFADV